jgi:hypothetical protein
MEKALTIESMRRFDLGLMRALTEGMLWYDFTKTALTAEDMLRCG